MHVNVVMSAVAKEHVAVALYFVPSVQYVLGIQLKLVHLWLSSENNR